MELTLKPVTDNKEQEEILLRECTAIRSNAFKKYPNVGNWTRSFNWRLAYIYEELLAPYKYKGVWDGDTLVSDREDFLPGIEYSTASEFASALADTSNDVEWVVEAFSRAYLPGGSGLGYTTNAFEYELKAIVNYHMDTDRDL